LREAAATSGTARADTAAALTSELRIERVIRNVFIVSPFLAQIAWILSIQSISQVRYDLDSIRRNIRRKCFNPAIR
jgi:hypothetical protein